MPGLIESLLFYWLLAISYVLGVMESLYSFQKFMFSTVARYLHETFLYALQI